MDRVVAAYRLLPRAPRPVGPFEPSADADLYADDVGRFLDACHVVAEKLREFGFEDKDFGGKIRLTARDDGELANGRYMPASDRIFIFHPPVRSVPDLPWTITHEVGHRIWKKVLGSADRELWELLAQTVGEEIPKSAADALARMAIERPSKFPLWFFFQKRFGNNPAAFSDWLCTKSYSKEFPTDYSAADPAEAFADSFAEMVLGRGHAGAGLRRTGAFIKKSLAGILDPYRGRPFFEDLLLEQQDELFLQSQVDLPELEEHISRWIQKSLAGAEVVKLPRRPHVTLVNGLDKSDAEQIRQVGSSFGRAIRVLPGMLNYFDAPSYDVLYLEVISPSLQELRRDLLRLPSTRPQAHSVYTPHITVAYLKKGSARRFVGNTPIRMIVTRPGFSLIDAAGTETFVPTASTDEPLLLANEAVVGAAS